MMTRHSIDTYHITPAFPLANTASGCAVPASTRQLLVATRLVAVGRAHRQPTTMGLQSVQHGTTQQSTQGVAGMQTTNASGTHHNLVLQPVQHSTSQHKELPRCRPVVQLQWYEQEQYLSRLCQASCMLCTAFCDAHPV